MRLTRLVALLALVSAAHAAEARRIIFGADSDNSRPAVEKLFLEAGLDCVRLTGGGFGWAAKDHSDRAKLLASQNVRSYLQLGSHYPDAEYFAYKDAWLVDQDGKTGIEDRSSWAIRYDYSCWPQYSYAHLGIRERFEKDFTYYLQQFPPGKNLAGVILHNEPGMHWLQERIFDYSAVNIAAFRAWLPSQHADIAELNARWGSSFASFAEVVPPGKPTPETVAPWMDWRRHQVVRIAEFMRWEAEFVKRVRPDLPRTTNLDGPTNNWYPIRCADIEAYSRSMDVVGMDVYPGPWTDRALVPYAIDQLVGVAQGRSAHVLECEVYGSRADEWKQLSEEQRGDRLRSQLWTIYGHGADGIMLWGFCRGDAFSLTDGEWNPRVGVCRDLARTERMVGLGRFRRAPSQVAICLDPDAYIRAGALSSGTLAASSGLDAEFHGIHAALMAAGIQVDVIMAAQLAKAAGRYRAIVLPAAPQMDQATADRLRAFTAGGGTLIASAPFATLDRWGAALPSAPGFGLGALVGAPSGEAVAAADGVPAIGVQSAGTGRCALFASAPGGAFLAGGAPGLPRALTALLARGRVAPTVRIASAGDVRPDASLLADGADRLLVIAAQAAKTEAVPAATAVRIEIPGTKPKAAFAFPPTGATGGVVRSGPVVLPFAATADGIAVEPGTVASALPILLTAGTTPLLALEAPATIAVGAAGTLTVTVHNPSAAALDGEVRLGTATARVRVPAWGSASAALPFTAPAVAQRLPLDAVLRAGGHETASIPVDVTVQ